VSNVIPIEVGDDIGRRCLRLYEQGLPPGDSTGWPSVDRHYTVARGQWTLITGVPSSGKSEWLDALAMNLMERDGWTFALYSPENYPTETHLAKLAEKHVRKPFGRGPVERMTEAELQDAMEFVTRHCFWLAPKHKSPAALLEAADRWRKSARSKFAIVLDPWNALEHLRPQAMSETEYVSETLTLITDFCRAADCHVFVVAHPAKLPRDRDGKRPIPTPYDIHGSAHWYNKADNIVCVHRDQVDGGQDVEIHVQKVRFKHIGRVGFVTLKYDRVTGRYFEFNGPELRDFAGRKEQYADPEAVVERAAIQREGQ
jgi:twinkle protein